MSFEKKCLECGEVFTPDRNHPFQRFCSHKCGNKYDYEKNIDRYAKSRGEYHQRKRERILKLLGGRCANPYDLLHPDWCNDIRILHIDHINGGGCKARKRESQTLYFERIYQEIVNGSKEYQLLCPNCNWLKRLLENELKRRK
jgi:hypothetical protein